MAWPFKRSKVPRAQAEELVLPEAVQQGRVTFEVLGAGEGVTSHIKLRLYPLTARPLQLSIPRGTEFVPMATGANSLLHVPLDGLQGMVTTTLSEVEISVSNLAGSLTDALERLQKTLEELQPANDVSEVDEIEFEPKEIPEESSAVDVQEMLEKAIESLRNDVSPEEFMKALEAEELYIDFELPSVCGSRYGELPPPVDSSQRFEYDDRGRLTPLTDPTGSTTSHEYDRPTSDNTFGVRYLIGTDPSPLIKVFDAVDQLPQLDDLARDSGMPEQMYHDTVRQHLIWAINGQYDGSAFTRDTTREIIDGQIALVGVHMDDEQRDQGVQAVWAAIDTTFKPFQQGPTPAEPNKPGSLADTAKDLLGGSLPGTLGPPEGPLGKVLSGVGGEGMDEMFDEAQVPDALPPESAPPSSEVGEVEPLGAQREEGWLEPPFPIDFIIPGWTFAERFGEQLDRLIDPFKVGKIPPSVVPPVSKMGADRSYPPVRIPPLPEFPPRKDESRRLDSPDYSEPHRFGWQEGIMNEPPGKSAMDRAADEGASTDESPLTEDEAADFGA